MAGDPVEHAKLASGRRWYFTHLQGCTCLHLSVFHSYKWWHEVWIAKSLDHCKVYWMSTPRNYQLVWQTNQYQTTPNILICEVLGALALVPQHKNSPKHMQNPPLLHVYNAWGWLCPADSPKTALRSSCGCQVPHAADVPAGACKTTSTRAEACKQCCSPLPRNIEMSTMWQVHFQNLHYLWVLFRWNIWLFGHYWRGLAKRSWAKCQWEANVHRLMYSSLDATLQPSCPISLFILSLGTWTMIWTLCY